MAVTGTAATAASSAIDGAEVAPVVLLRLSGHSRAGRPPPMPLPGAALAPLVPGAAAGVVDAAAPAVAEEVPEEDDDDDGDLGEGGLGLDAFLVNPSSTVVAALAPAPVMAATDLPEVSACFLASPTPAQAKQHRRLPEAEVIVEDASEDEDDGEGDEASMPRSVAGIEATSPAPRSSLSPLAAPFVPASCGHSKHHRWADDDDDASGDEQPTSYLAAALRPPKPSTTAPGRGGAAARQGDPPQRQRKHQ